MRQMAERQPWLDERRRPAHLGRGRGGERTRREEARDEGEGEREHVYGCRLLMVIQLTLVSLKDGGASGWGSGGLKKEGKGMDGIG